MTLTYFCLDFFFHNKNTFPSQRSMYNDILYVKGHSTTPTSTSKPGSINRCNKEDNRRKSDLEYNRRRRKMTESPRNMMCRLAGILLLLVSLFSFFNNSFVHGDNRKHNKAPYTEEERMAEYVRQGYQFPFDTYYPETPGFREIMDQRFAQIRSLTDTQMKWDGWIQTVNAAVSTPNFTEYGWGLSQAPDLLTLDIRQAIYEGLPRARSEGGVDVIDGPVNPLFIDRPDLNARAMRELQPILESWAGIELVPAQAYGFRLYRNESSLWMHTDRTQTHVISCIYHIASSDDSEPWPIVIEDYEGNTQMAYLEPGDLLLYESAKNFHGRPTKFDGSWYTSLFVHFYPKGDWQHENHDTKAHYAIPPDWAKVIPNDVVPKLEVIGTSMMNPLCDDHWCNLKTAKKVFGPGQYNTVLTSNGQISSLHLDGATDDEEL